MKNFLKRVRNAAEAGVQPQETSAPERDFRDAFDTETNGMHRRHTYNIQEGENPLKPGFFQKYESGLHHADEITWTGGKTYYIYKVGGSFELVLPSEWLKKILP